MTVLLRIVCFIALLISYHKADECKEHEEQVISVFSANKIDVRPCLPNVDNDKVTIIWYKNDSRTLISMKQDSRIHQHKDKIWFVPAKVEDSGHYYCVVRNSTYCLRIKITAKVVENEPNLCYSAQATFPQKLPISEDGRIVCPFMNFFKDENNEFPHIHWYKDCKPLLGNINFIGVENKLIVRNVTEESKGNYTCHASYTHLGKQYHVTRVIELTTMAEELNLRAAQ
ncbi:interleukin-1 receptor type 1 isoform X3 [Choloepus didactylus]|uniref:interleukin-1 receptor type 1 isoform X3 n=1 Tax=Choloepus didactylus TaxID=27675 RepID=UPI0018A002E3|nr:interleukin-1 receptor type 1 isoform X3 [Choloepus didactylus]XP_037663716.1 interleukin-1 receptor type 1 isoform X3 [Choloepus didactylus]